MTLYQTTVHSPIGELTLVASDTGLREIDLPLPGRRSVPSAEIRNDHPVLRQASAELDEYFAGTRTTFDVPLDPADGTAFQRSVWGALTQIPYGVTESYGALAQRIGSPAAARAVGAANGRNPLPIVVPCHRVVGATGAMTGYGGPSEQGIAMKRWLLEHERTGASATGT